MKLTVFAYDYSDPSAGDTTFHFLTAEERDTAMLTHARRVWDECCASRFPELPAGTDQELWQSLCECDHFFEAYPFSLDVPVLGALAQALEKTYAVLLSCSDHPERVADVIRMGSTAHAMGLAQAALATVRRMKGEGVESAPAASGSDTFTGFDFFYRDRGYRKGDSVRTSSGLRTIGGVQKSRGESVLLFIEGGWAYAYNCLPVEKNG